MFSIGVVVILLNFLDTVFTTAGLAQGVVVEVNPVLSTLYSLNPELTFLGKIILVPLGVIFIIIKGKGKSWAYWGLLVCLLVYVWAAGLHLLWLSKVF